jgi:transcriptional regulator with XRE-family HTH domain
LLNVAFLRLSIYNIRKKGGDSMNIGHRIKERRKELKISADDLGRKLGKDRSTIYRYEKGDIENLPLDILEPIASALLTTPQFLMGWENQDEETDNINIKKQSTESELSMRKKEFMRKVAEMSDDQIERLEQILALVEAKDQ